MGRDGTGSMSIAWGRSARVCLAAVGGLLLSSATAIGQSCPCPPFDLAGAVRGADVIFVGKALSAATDSTPAETNAEGTWEGGEAFQTRLLFEVAAAVKGEPPPFVEVVTPTGPCAFGFAVGETHLVVGTRVGGTVATDACRGNLSGGDAIAARAAAISKLLHPAADRSVRRQPR